MTSRDAFGEEDKDYCISQWRMFAVPTPTFGLELIFFKLFVSLS